MSKRIAIAEILFYLGVLFAFLGGLNLLSFQGYLLFASGAFLIASTLFYGNVKLDLDFFLVGLFGAAYIVFYWLKVEFSINDLIYFLFVPLAFYQVGSNSTKENKKAFILFFSFSIGLFLRATLCVSYTTLFSGFSLGDGEVLFDIWTGEPMARTGLSLCLTPLCGIGCYYLIFHFSFRTFKRKWPLYVLSLIPLTLSLVWSSLLGNRAPIVVFGILIMFLTVFRVLKTDNGTAKMIVFIVSLFVALCLFALCLGLVPSFLSNIEVFRRFLDGGSNSARLQLYKDFFANFYRYPFGGTYVTVTETFVHNFYLDIYNFAGVIPFVLFTVVFVRFFYVIWLYLKNPSSKNDGFEIAAAMILSLVSLGLFEPLFQANPFMFSFFSLAFGSGAAFRRKEYVKITRWRI